MKLRVVGWTCYDFYDFESGENSWAVHMAVVDEIKSMATCLVARIIKSGSIVAPFLTMAKCADFPSVVLRI